MDNRHARRSACAPLTASAEFARLRLSLIGLVLALGFPLLPLSRWEDEFRDVAHLVGYELIWWAVVAGLALHVAQVERRPLDSIGLRPLRPFDYVCALGAAAVMMAGLPLFYLVLFHPAGTQEGAAISNLASTPLWWRLASVVRAATAEELLFRGYGFERLKDFSGSATAALVTWAAFTIAHVGAWGWAHLVVAGFGGAVLTALYVWRRNLTANILAHLIVDGCAVLFV
ncbi:CPBP family intramembrane glutamic endopeptidase [Caulobacter soli]|uniref:CPBP family intramembrane glutamic endopeptidase n=1 Tax=Caulobacter soli TaxID=2708539 RepID=UPI0013EB0A79|nr:CPBP family intramembrane glutamic endopeptidase [Caulobacter soli]